MEEVPTICPKCGGNCYDYNRMPACEDCYYRDIQEMEEMEKEREN